MATIEDDFPQPRQKGAAVLEKPESVSSVMVPERIYMTGDLPATMNEDNSQ